MSPMKIGMLLEVVLLRYLCEFHARERRVKAMKKEIFRVPFGSGNKM